MAKEVDHGYYQEFTRTPHEQKEAEYRKRVEELELRVVNLEEKFSVLYTFIKSEIKTEEKII